MDNKHKFLKRFLAFILSAAMVITYMPASLIAYAGEADEGQTVTETVEQQPSVDNQTGDGQDEKDGEAQPETVVPDDADQNVDEDSQSVSQPAAKQTESETPEATDNVSVIPFSGNDNSIDVSVEAPEGSFPDGTRMKVEKVEAEQVQDAVEAALGKKVKDLRAVDVSFYTDSKSHIQPADPVRMTMQSSELDPDAKLVVLHIADNSETAKEVDDVTFTGGKASFETSSFSTYILAVADDEDTTQNEETAQNTETDNESPAAKKTENITLRDAAPATVEVSVEGVDGITSKEITLGDFEGNESLAIEGYDFVEGWYEDIKITGIQKDENGDIYFGTIEGNAITAVTLDLSKVLLVYEPHVEKYNITYKVTVDGTEVEDYSAILDLVGPAHIKTGSTIEILPTPSKGYSVSSVTATNGTVTEESGTSKYQLSGVTEDTVVTVALNEITSYRFTFTESSNTTLRINNTNYNSGATHNTTYTPAGSISFTLTGRNQWSNNAKILNQLSITLDGENIAASIPDTAGQSATTIIPGGYQVTVTKNNANALPTYAVVISATNGDKVRGDITVNTNFKDYNSSEVWAKQLDGVEPLAYYNGSSYITSDTGGTNEKRLTPDAFCFYNRNTGNASSYYIKLDGTYSADDLYLYVYNYKTTVSGSTYTVEYDSDIISRFKVSELDQIGNLPNALRNAGYSATDYMFTIPADVEGSATFEYVGTGGHYSRQRSWRWGAIYYDGYYYYESSRGTYDMVEVSGADYDDIRIFIKYEPDESQTQIYTVWYDAANGTAAYREDGNKEYDLDEGKTTVIDEDIPTREGYVFEGWYLEGDEDTLYQAGDLFTLDESVKDKATADNRFLFRAKWTSASSATYAPYRINVYFEDDNGVYHDGTGSTEDTPDFSSSERGNIGSIPYIISSKFNSWIDERKPGWDEDFEYDKQTPSEAIKADGSTVIKIYYREKRISLNFVAEDNVEKINLVSGNPVSVTGDGTGNMTVVVRQKHGDAVKVQAVAADGYIINGWTINEETTKLSDYASLQTAIADDSAATNKWTTRTYHAWAETEKTITVTKEVHVIGTVHADDVDMTVYFALDKDTSGATDYLKKEDGSIWTESITITDGVPESNKVTFTGVPTGEYEVWEVADASASGLRPSQTVIPSDSQGKAIILSNIQTRHDASSSGSNDVSVNEDQTSDAMTVINTFAHAGESISWTARKSWTDKDGNALTTVPEGAYATFGIFANGAEEPVATIRLDGTVEADDLEEKNPWEATFDALSRVDEEDNEISYVVKEIDYAGKTSPLDGVYYTPVNDSIDASGMSINNKQQYGSLTVRKTVDVTGFREAEVKAAMAGLTVNVTGPHDYSEEVKFTGDPTVSGTKYTFTEELTDLPVGDYNVSEDGYEDLFEGRTWNPDYSNTTVTRDGRTIATAPAGATAQANVIDGKTTIASIANDYHYLDITATKIWEDGDAAATDHPAIKIGLYKIEGEEETLVGEEEIPAGATDDDLKVTWSKQDQQYDYTVKEARLKDYEEPVIDGNKTDGFTVTNTRMETGTLKIVKVVDGPQAAKNKTFQINYESEESAQGGVSSVNLLPTSGTAETEMTVTAGEYTVTEQPGSLNLDNYTRTTTMKVGEDGEETSFPQDATGAPHLSDVVVAPGQTTVVYITNKYVEDTVVINYVSENENWGTVSPSSETLGVETGEAEGSEATPKQGYKFKNWTIGEGAQKTVVSENAKYIPTKGEDELWTTRTYTAHFETLPIVITSATNSWTYDGVLHKDDTYTVTYDGTAVTADAESEGKVFTLPTGDVLTITSTADGVTDVSDNSDNNNTFTYTIKSGETDTKANYSITEKVGTLTINAKKVTITAKDASKTYDGSELTQPEFTASPLETGDTHTFTVTMTAGSKRTDKGSTPNVIATVDGVEVTTGVEKAIGNYLVTTADGTLTINPKAVTITAKDAEKAYDGDPLTQPEFTTTALEEGDSHTFIVVMTDDSTITDFGTQPNVIATVDGTAVTTGTATEIGNYVVTTANGTLTITKDTNAIVITSASNSWTYDGDTHKDDTYTVTYGGTEVTAGADGKTFTLSNGDVVKITSTAAGVKEVSDTDSENNTYTYTVTKNGKDTSGNYSSITANKGTLTINPKAVTITANNASQTYNGSALTESGFTATALETGDDHTFTVVMTEDSTITDVGTQPNVIATVDGVAVTTEEATAVGNYVVTIVNGTLTVNPKAVTITAKNASQTYNGSALTESGFTATALETGDTHTFTVAMTEDSTITNVGTQPNVIATVDGVAVITGTETAVGNYLVTTVNGTLTVNPKAVTITAKDASKTYDGAALTQPEFTAGALESGDDHTFTVVMTDASTITDIGTQPNVIATVDGVAVTTGTATAVGNYLVTTADGTLTVNPKKVTITAKDAAKEYDGTALTQSEFTVTGLAETDDHEFAVVMTADSTITNYGNQPNVIATVDGVAVTTGTEKAVGNYLVTTKNGTLSISRKSVTITAKDATKEYDGTALTQPEFTVAGLAATDTHKFTVAMTAASTITDVGTQTNRIATVDGTVVDVGTPQAVGNYMVSVANGTLTVNPKKVTITAKDASQTYNGSALTQNQFTVAGQANTDTHTFTVAMTAASTITNVGTQPNVIATVDGTAVTTGTETEVGNYLVTTADGTLTVSPKKVTITAKDASQTYNGSALTQSEFTAGALEEGDDHTFTVVMTSDSTITNVGEKPNVIATVDGVTVTTGTETEVGNYLVTTADGTLTVNPKKVTITANDANKPYDGGPLTEAGFTASALEQGDSHTFTVVMTSDSTITNVGEKPNVIATVDGTAVTTGTETAVGNYLVTTANGTLTVTKDDKVLEISSANKNWTYDGQLHKEEVYTVRYAGQEVTSTDGKTFRLSTGDTVTITPTAAGVRNVSDNAANNNTFRYVISNPDNYDEKNIVIKTGTISIDPKAVTITAKDASRTYNGRALTQPEFTATALENGDDHTFTVVMTEDSTITNVGTQPNVIATVDGTAVTAGTQTAVGNYLVTTANGTLTVTEKKVTITANNASQTYNGSALTQPAFTAGALEEGDSHTFTVVMTEDSTITNVGTQPNVIATVDGVAVTTGTETKVGNYLVTTADGTLTVNPKKVTITAKDASKPYDGSPLTQPEFTATALEEGDDHTFTVAMTADSTITDFGTQPNVISTVDGVAVTTGTEKAVGNYLVTTKNGTLSISRKTVTITAKDATKEYDGTALTQPEFTVAGLAATDTHKFTVAMTAASTITDVGTQTNRIATVDGTVVDVGTPQAVGNYMVSVANGTLTVNPKAVTITANDASKTYDGDPLTQPQFTAAGQAGTDTHTFTVVMTDDSTITDAGTQPNVIATVDGTAVTAGTATGVGNYLITAVNGTLTVNAANMEDPDNPGKPDTSRFDVSQPSDVVYNGEKQEQTVTITDTKTGKTLEEGKDYDVKYSDATNAGTVTVTITGKGNYAGSFTRTYRITPAPLRVVTDSAEKTYDGTALTAGGRVTGLVNGETVTFRPTGSRTAVGSSQNTYSITWDGTASRSNYEIVSETLGTLTVNAAPAPTPTPGGGGGNPGGGPAVTPAGPVTPAVVPDEPVPQVEPADIPDDPTPAAPPEGTWALLNLLAAALTTLGAAIALFRKKEEEDEEDEDEEDNRGRKMILAKVLGGAAAAASIITFILTEDMSLPMALTDKWTLLMAVLFAAQIGTAVANKKASELDDEEEEEGAEA